MMGVFLCLRGNAQAAELSKSAAPKNNPAQAQLGGVVFATKKLLLCWFFAFLFHEESPEVFWLRC
jgi:hypothetical protein